MTRMLCACGGRVVFLTVEREYLCRVCGHTGPPHKSPKPSPIPSPRGRTEVQQEFRPGLLTRLWRALRKEK